VPEIWTFGGMKTIALILLCLLAVWRGVLTIHVIFLHRERTRLAAKWTPENEKAHRRFLEGDHRIRADDRRRFADYVFVSPFVFLFLPYFLYCKFVKDPFGKHDNAA
jgi:hypothetical protein